MSADLCVRGFGISRFGSSSSSDQSTFRKNSFLFPNFNRFSLRLINPQRIRKSACISCDNPSHGNFDFKSHRHQSEDDYLEASLLISGIFFYWFSVEHFCFGFQTSFTMYNRGKIGFGIEM